MVSPSITARFVEFVRLSWGIGWGSFGGPAAQINLLHRIFVKERALLTEEAFQKALGLCTLLPGPEAQQLAATLGFKLHGIRGAVTGGFLFVLPGALVMACWSALYVIAPGHPVAAVILQILRPAALGLILSSVAGLALRVLKTPSAWGIALGSGLALWLLNAPFPLLIACSALLSACLGTKTPPPLSPRDGIPSVLETLAKAAVGLLLWFGPLLALGFALGWNSPLWLLGLFLSKTALSTFGGAYAVLPYVALSAVQEHAWITHAQMLDGLALGETTPGPLLLVLQFYGFLTGWNAPGALSAPFAALLGSVVALWATFFPAVLWVLLAMPYTERLSQFPRINQALLGVSLAVVGSLAFLGITLMRTTLWSPDFNGTAALITLGVLLWRWPRQKPAA